MGKDQQHRAERPDPDITLGGRTAAAFVSGLFSLPVIGLLWLLFNSKMAVVSESVIPVKYLVVAVIAFAAFSFIFPKFASTVFGKLVELLMGLGRYW